MSVFKKKTALAIFVVFLLAIATHWFWFTAKDKIFSYGDWSYHFPESSKDFITLSFSWAQNNGIGNPILGPGFYPILFVSGLLSNFLGLNSSLYIFFYPCIFSASIFSFIFIQYITKSLISAVIGSLLFSYNTYFLLIQNRHLTVATAYALTPLVFYYFIKTLKDTSIRNIIITGIILLIHSQYEIRIAYIAAGILIIYLIYEIIMIKEDRIKKVSATGFVFIVLILCNAFWLTGIFFGDGLSDASFLKRDLSGENFMNMRQALTSFHPFWTGKEEQLFDKLELVPLHFWLIPIIAFLPLLFKKINKNIIFFSLLALIGIFLVKQSAEPFTGIYRWLYYHFPGFNAFRESTKFYLIINLSYAVLIGYSANAIYQFLKNKLNKKFIGEFFVFFVASLFLWNAMPLVTQKMHLTKPKTIPQEYVMLKDYLINQKDFFRVMGVPAGHRYSFFNNEHPQVSASHINLTQWKDFGQEFHVDVINFVKQPYMNWLLDSASIKYVYIPFDIDNEIFNYENREGNIIKMWGGNRNQIESELDKIKWLTNKMRMGKIVIYENKEFIPHITISY